MDADAGPTADRDAALRAWWCWVSRTPHTPGAGYVFHTTDADVSPLTATAARSLCELAVLADLCRRAGSIGVAPT